MYPELAQEHWTHCEVMGEPRMGKTTHLRETVEENCVNDNPVIVIACGKDELYDQAVGFIARTMPNYPLRTVNLTDRVRSNGYNPFHLPKGRSLSAHVSALAKCSGGSPFEARFHDPETASCYFAYLCTHGIPVWETMHLFDYANRKQWLALEVPEEYRHQARAIGAIPADVWEYKIGALRRFLDPFVTSEAIRRITAIPQPVEIAHLYERRISLFVKASPSGDLTQEAGAMFSSFILADIYATALQNAGRKLITPVYCDELHLYAPPAMAQILDTALSSGYYFTIAHQRPGQFSDPRLEAAVRGACGVKVIFGGLSADFRKPLAENAFPKEVNKRWHKEEKYRTNIWYMPYEDESETTHQNGEISKTKRTNHLPEYSYEVIGYEDYTREQVISMLAGRFVLPKYHYIILKPDGTCEKGVTHKLKTYLRDSEETVQLLEKIPDSLSYDEAKRLAERSAKNATGTAKKRRPVKLDAEG